MLGHLFLLAELLARTTAFAMFEGQDSHKTTTNIFTVVDSESQFPFSSTVLLSLSDDVRSFSYIACGRGPSIDRYFASTTDPPPKPTTPALPSSPVASPSPPTVSPTPRTRSTSARSTPSKTSSLATPSSTTAYPTSATTSAADSDPLSTSVSGSNNVGNTNDTSNATGASIANINNNNSTSGKDSSGGGGSTNNNLGLIVGAAVRSVALICVSLVVVLWLLRRRRVRELRAGVGTNGKDSAEADRDSATPQPQTPQTQPPLHEKHHWSGGWGPGELPGHVDYVNGRPQGLPGNTRTPPELPNKARMLPELASNPEMPPDLHNKPHMPPELPNKPHRPQSCLITHEFHPSFPITRTWCMRWNSQPRRSGRGDGRALALN
ncbi:hypothetical protein B0T26DRAFT_873600 [Lasiosphaeria miniovina]|uniref:Mid2 domain-containing protein n=1 Tax=Lasiosphaeria miniovina TaxID=1954250 RepID=A0AA40ACX3_9PEZI|nr:uncharacterized protein B0T26DRAFT_873600 [Lasiosphaeria miniovina]KAK0713440.1 hypothetical protein B0T26DRAFT_873600 [Lasiosphaeria miniovina]